MAKPTSDSNSAPQNDATPGVVAGEATQSSAIPATVPASSSVNSPLPVVDDQANRRAAEALYMASRPSSEFLPHLAMAATPLSDPPTISPVRAHGGVTVDAAHADPTVRARMAKNALHRQRDNKAPRPRRPFVVEVAKGSEILRMKVEANSRDDAWAIACDQWKYHPGGQAPGRLVMTPEEYRKVQVERAQAEKAAAETAI